jgi:hypothetical protein
MSADPVSGVAVAAAPETSAMDKVRNVTSNSWGILVMSVIGGVYSGILYKGAEKQEKEAKENIEKLDKLIKTFKDSYTNFCPQGRESLNEPKCYCYLESGKQNPNRTNSQTCKDLWAKDSYMLTAKSGDYSSTGQFVDPVGCVNLNGQFDEKCTCKKFVDSKGGNACMKTSSINLPSGFGANFASDSGLNDVAKLANNSANGNPQLNSFNVGQLNAIKAKKLASDILKKLGNRIPLEAQKLLKVDESNVAKLSRSVFGNSPMSSSPSATGIAGSRDTDAQTSALLKQAAANAGLVEVTGTGNGLSNKKGADNKPNFNFLNDSGNSGASQSANFQATDKNYNYKDSDISKSSDTSIFEIISNRYIQSGLKRLFDQ